MTPHPASGPNLSLEFIRIVAQTDGERAIFEGTIELPALPVCTIRMRTDADRLTRRGPGQYALVRYIEEALKEDATDSLPLN
jgi:hypothetical protein